MKTIMLTALPQSTLARLVQAAARVTPRRTTKPILTHLLVQATELDLVVTGTNNEMTYTGQVETHVEVQGSICPPADDLNKLVKSLPKDSVVRLEAMDPGEGKAPVLVLRCGTIEFSLDCLSAEEYPEQPDVDRPDLQIPSHDLVKLFRKTLYAVSHEETRYFLGGVYLVLVEENNQKLLRAVATDGHRLALAQRPVSPSFQMADLEKGVILSRHLVGEVLPVLESYNAGVSFGIHDRRSVFQTTNTLIHGLLVDGSFPDYKQVIPPPEKNVIVFTVGRTALSDALKRVALMSPNENGVRVTVDQKLTLSSQHTSRGKGRQELEIRHAQPGIYDFEIGLNATYLGQALDAIPTDKVELHFSNHLSPCLVRPYHKPEDVADDVPVWGDQLAVVMPMRL